MHVIKTENLTKFYGKSRGITELSFSVDEGDIFGYIGPNGAGKSTTIRILLGLIAPTQGKAEILGLDCQKNTKEILKRVGYIPSEVFFWDYLRCEEVFALSAALRKCDCRKESQLLCERLALDPKKKVSELSLGTRKKVSIVCALQHKPDMYILDEPTSGLDPNMQREFWDLLHERNQEGATIFLSSHTLSEIQKHCKTAAIIREGTIQVKDKVESLSASNVKKVVIQGLSMLPPLQGIKN
ncbi:MAG TPA: ABC transporter, partial [Clostridiales bacterium]|nr:ABC transporter [Clostridiales bacterium]